MDEQVLQLEQHLRTVGRSVTHARRTVFQALDGNEPQTIEHIVAACRGKADRASVYRTIALFEELGIVQRLQIGWKYKLELSDAYHHHHHHLTCRSCGKTLRLPEDQQLERRLKALAAEQSFTMQGHQLEVQGLCEQCRPRA